MNRSSPTRLLITGFDPFGGSTLNPSQAAIEAIASAEQMFDDAQLHTGLLPVDTQRIADRLDALWQDSQPDIVIHLGESAKASRLTLERVALNLLDFDTPDNAGQQVVDQPIHAAGPAALFATLPIRLLRDRLNEQGIDAELSLSAGAYLCNQALYLSLAQARHRGGAMVGFVHVPSLPEQVNRGERKAPSMPLEQLVAELRCLVGLAIALYRGDETTPAD